MKCRKTGKICACDKCGKEFYRKAACISEKNYCSYKCSHSKTLFRKGIEPWNKNLKGIHLSPKSEFKKGRKSTSKAEIEDIKIRIKTRDKKPRAFVKIEEPNKWIMRAQFVWINENGEIPKGYVIHHKDKDTLNDTIENLQCLSRKDHINIHRKDL